MACFGVETDDDPFEFCDLLAGEGSLKSLLDFEAFLRALEAASASTKFSSSQTVSVELSRLIEFTLDIGFIRVSWPAIIEARECLTSFSDNESEA